MSTGWRLIDVSKVHGNGKVVIPRDARITMGVKDGDKVAFYQDSEGRIYIEKIAMSTKGPRFDRR